MTPSAFICSCHKFPFKPSNSNDISSLCVKMFQTNGNELKYGDFCRSCMITGTISSFLGSPWKRLEFVIN